MKKAVTLSIGIFLISFSTLIASTNAQENHYNPYYLNYGNSYIFTVKNVEFSVFPDGQFDFTYIGNYNNTNVIISSPNVNVSFNSGYNYEMFVQYDMYGGVIQVENVPIYYDQFGRVSQVGNINIYYNRNRIVRVGGLYVHYNRYGYYTHCTGFINSFNFYYTYKPWHSYYVRPVYAHCIVYDYPYRKNYIPTRYSYTDHHNYYRNRGRNNNTYANGRRSFHKPGSRNHYKGGRTEVNRDYNPNRRHTRVVQLNKYRPSRNNKMGLRKSDGISSKRTVKTRPVSNSQSFSFNNNLTTRPTVNSNKTRRNTSFKTENRKTSFNTNINDRNKKPSNYKSTRMASNTKKGDINKRKEEPKVNTSKRRRGL